MCALVGDGADARALHPTLRQFLEDRLGGFAIESQNPVRQETPVEIEGRLLADAFATNAGASMRVRVERVSVGACLESAEGGVSLTVLGALAADGLDEWRAGRTIRAMAVLRRPAKYLNGGVPDQERSMGRRGIALVGSVKSAALVPVGPRGVEARPPPRLRPPSDAQSSPLAAGRAVGRRGDRDSDRRSRRA